MVRNHAILVHKQLSDQLKSGFLKQPPQSFSALMNFPPNPTPPLNLSILNRPSDVDLPMIKSNDPNRKVSKGLNPRLKPIRITYDLKDRLRRAFFRDHPIEAYRSKSLVEVDLIDQFNRTDKVKRVLEDGSISNSEFVGLDQWTLLSQRSIVPDPEDCIDFAYALHVHNPSKFSLNVAYSISVSQFRTLRFEDQIRASFARQEAEYYYSPTPTLTTTTTTTSTSKSSSSSSSSGHKKKIAGDGKDEGGVWGRDLLRREDELFKSFISDLNGFKNNNSNNNNQSVPTQQQNNSSPSSKNFKSPSSQSSDDQLSFGILRDHKIDHQGIDDGGEVGSKKDLEKFEDGRSVFDQIKFKSNRLKRV